MNADKLSQLARVYTFTQYARWSQHRTARELGIARGEVCLLLRKLRALGLIGVQTSLEPDETELRERLKAAIASELICYDKMH
jgi:DNA-binding transcriptional regulator LsrR (DeoR family)